MSNLAEAIIARLAQHGVRRIYGVPGGDCTLDFIEAAARHGIHYVLARNESGAAMAAMAEARISGAPGVVMTTRGPGLTNAANGVACAALDRVPLLILADGHEPDMGHVSHQRFDQMAVLHPLVKAASVTESADPVAELDLLLATASAAPAGPVYMELVGQRMRAPHPISSRPLPQPPHPVLADAESYNIAQAVLAKAKKPVIIAGLQAQANSASAGLRWLAGAWGVPVLSTYMAKGAISDSDPHAVGPFVSGAAEDAIMRAADVIVLYGADPIEFLPKPWPYKQPIVELTAHAFARPHIAPAAQMVGDLAESAMALEHAVEPGGWDLEELATVREAMRQRAMVPSADGISPGALMAAVVEAAPANARMTVDAGAHTLVAMALWRAEQPNDAMISRGLATMAFALPSAIGAALADPSRRVVACTGDGGLMMNAGELSTAAQEGCNLVCVVFNDAAVSLIEVKQRRRQFPLYGMRSAPADLAAVARGFGCTGIRVDRPEQLAAALREAFATPGPVLVDVAVDAAPYHEIVPLIRG